MKKVLAGGTFNIIHPGHVLFLEKAKALGDCLVVVVANDRTVLKRKGILLMPAEARRKVLESLRPVDKAVVGDERDFFRVVESEKPDIIALGHDQALDKSLERRIRARGIKIVRIKSLLKGCKTEKILGSLKEKGHGSGL
jgi:FAD synthetase